VCVIISSQGRCGCHVSGTDHLLHEAAVMPAETQENNLPNKHTHTHTHLSASQLLLTQSTVLDQGCRTQFIILQSSAPPLIKQTWSS